jgi:hypothetical protein
MLVLKDDGCTFPHALTCMRKEITERFLDLILFLSFPPFAGTFEEIKTRHRVKGEWLNWTEKFSGGDMLFALSGNYSVVPPSDWMLFMNSEETT